MKEADIKNLQKFYTNLQKSIRSFSQDITNANIQATLNDENKLPSEFSCDAETLNDIIQTLESLRQKTNKILINLLKIITIQPKILSFNYSQNILNRK